MKENKAVWVAQVKGNPYGNSWEISVVRSDNEHGQLSWGWFDENKLLISHNGGPCRWPLAPGLAPLIVEVAHRYAEMLNDGKINPKITNNPLPQSEIQEDCDDPRRGGEISIHARGDVFLL